MKYLRCDELDSGEDCTGNNDVTENAPCHYYVNFFNKRFIVSYLLTWERNDIKMQLFWRVNVSPMVSVSPFCVKVEPFPPSFVGLPSLTIFFRWVDWRFHFHRKQFPFNEFEQFDEISVLQVCLCFNFFKKANKLCFDTNARLMNALSPLKI